MNSYHQTSQQFRDIATLRGMVREIASKVRIFNTIAENNPHRRQEIKEKLRHLHLDLDKYEKDVDDITE